MFKKSLLAASLLAASSSVLADTVGSLSFVSFRGDSFQGVNVNGIALSAGYEFQLADNFSLTPEVHGGLGVSKDNVALTGTSGDAQSVEVKLDRYLAFSLRAQLDFSDDVYVFAAPTMTDARLSYSMPQGVTYDSPEDHGVYLTDDWDFGGAVGIGYVFEQDVSAFELKYETSNNMNMWGASFRLMF